MLLELNIKNYILIEKLNISFDKGFNVLTGETGAGKSIVIDAIGLLLGDRATKDCIRYGKDLAIIEGIFDISDKDIIKIILDKYGIDNSEEEILIITREIYSSSRSISRVNGRSITLSVLKEISSNLVDIYGQHEHQSLLDTEKHFEFIDKLNSKRVYPLLNEISKEFSDLINFQSKLKELTYDEREKERQLDMLKFQYKEIDDANLKDNEDEIVSQEYKKLYNTEEIIKNIENINNMLIDDQYEQTSVIDSMNKILSCTKDVSKFDKYFNGFNEIVQAIVFQLQDLYRDIRLYSENLEFDSEKLTELQDRLDLINKLKRKYGDDIKDILSYKINIKKQIDSLINNDLEISKTKDKIIQKENQIKTLCDNLTKIRKEISNKLEKLISVELNQLNMNNIKFKVNFDKHSYFTQDGIDKIEFLISTNIGEPLKSLSKIVSGGEMSRIMLAFKSILADIDSMSCLIFDEIDTGISGRTAQVVGEKIAKISKKHQVICITHLPQIAAMSDRHFLIDKKVVNNKSITDISMLSYKDKINELSRLLGGVNLTETTKNHAKETLDLALKYKMDI